MKPTTDPKNPGLAGVSPQTVQISRPPADSAGNNTAAHPGFAGVAHPPAGRDGRTEKQQLVSRPTNPGLK